MIPGLCKSGPKLPTHRQVFGKTIFCMLRNLSTHLNPYSASVAIWQQGLENFKNKILTIFLGFQNFLSILRLIVVKSLFTV